MRLFLLLALMTFSLAVIGQNKDSIYVREHYDKAEYQVPMRDGVKLFIVVYTPKYNSRTYHI